MWIVLPLCSLTIEYCYDGLTWRRSPGHTWPGYPIAPDASGLRTLHQDLIVMPGQSSSSQLTIAIMICQRASGRGQGFRKHAEARFDGFTRINPCHGGDNSLTFVRRTVRQRQPFRVNWSRGATGVGFQTVPSLLRDPIAAAVEFSQ